MNFEKFTEKSLGVLRYAQNSATEKGNAEIEISHFLLALLKDEGGLIPELLVSMGVDVKALTSDAERTVDSLPKISGAGYSAERIYLSQRGEKVLSDAMKNMEDMVCIERTRIP